MITINGHYLKDVNPIASQLEAIGFTVATVNEINPAYDDDIRREFRQNLSPHDWNFPVEWEALEKLIR